MKSKLPKKWFVKITPDNIQMLNHYRINVMKYDSQEFGMHRHFMDYSGQGWTGNPADFEHEEISYEYFVSRILKKNPNIPKEDLTFLKDLLIQNGIN